MEFEKFEELFLLLDKHRKKDETCTELYTDLKECAYKYANMRYRFSEMDREEKIENPTFFVFSNDMEWVKENIQINSRVFYVDIKSGDDSYKDMQLMSKCKHNIIANSSFSWWGAWLNENKNKIVVAPKKWVNRDDVDSDKIELFCKNWTLL